eukprot:4828570-Karenia_brevis.AAC.1
MRAKLGNLPGVTITTCHGAFKLDGPEKEALYLMGLYDVVVVDEYSLLTQAYFERLLKLWQAADK